MLVAAAAGSGKTAVLVERIFRIITEKTQKILYKNSKRLLQILETGAIILVYDSRKCERGGDASLSY